MKELEQKCLVVLEKWFKKQDETKGGGDGQYIVAAGIAVAEVLKNTFPVTEKDYVTERNQVRTSGSLIKRVLKDNGETRKYASEGGRTTRGTRPAAENLVMELNKIEGLKTATKEERLAVAKALQKWLVDNGVQTFFSKKRLEIEVNLDKPGSQIIADILEMAAKRTVAGPVAQHLVGAKLSLRYPKLNIENYSFTTADTQLGRPGDFLLHDTVFHVTVAPGTDVVGKCDRNIKAGYRPILLVSESKLQAARQLAELAGVASRLGINSLEQFVGQNVEEIGEYGKQALKKNLRALLEKYNERVQAVEADQSLQIDIPENL